MKKPNVLLRYLMPLVLAGSIAGCASTPTHESTGQYVDNTVITTEVKAALAGDDFLKSFQISVKSYKDTVQLSGFVNSQAAKDKAGELARGAKGVERVKNDLIVK
jgi:osmotically-inducible protein OsmY